MRPMEFVYAVFLTTSASTLAVSAVDAQGVRSEVYTADRAHSLLDFTVRLAGFNRTRGSFQQWSADVVYDPTSPEHSSVSFIAEVASIATGEPERDNDLRGDKFFDAKTYPYLRFNSDRVVVDGAGLLVEGRLTIRDVTRSVKLPVQIIAPLGRDPFNNLRISFATTLTINRRDFNVIGPRFWNEAISDSVTIEIELGGRIWEYSTLDWGPPARQSVGKLLKEAADSGKLAAAMREVRQVYASPARASGYGIGPRQFEYAAMRLAQAPTPRLDDARRILELGLDLLSTMSARDRASLLTRLGEVSYRLGDRARARDVLQQALLLAADNTNAMAWLWLTEASQ